MAADLSKLYIERLKSSLLNEFYIENEARVVQMLARTLNNLESTFEDIYTPDADLQAAIHTHKQDGRTTVLNREEPNGSLTPVYELRNYTELAHTMIGRKRLDSIQFCVEEVIKSGIPGDPIIVDDYFALTQCGRAITDFRAVHDITDPIRQIDDQSVYWRKS